MLGMVSSLHSQNITSAPKVVGMFKTVGSDCSPEGLYYQYGSNQISVSIQTEIKSAPYKWDGTSPLVFFKIVTSNDGKQIRTNVASADLSHSGVSPLLVFAKSKNNNQFTIVPLPEDANSFPANSCRVVNLSTNPINSKFSGVAVSIAPMSMKDFHLTNEVVSADITVNYASGINHIYNSNIGLPAGKRLLFIAVPIEQNMSSQHIQVQRLVDTPQLK